MKAPVDGVDPVGFFDRARRPTGWWADASAFGLVYNGRLRWEAVTPGVLWRRMKTMPDRTVPAGFRAGISARFPRGNTRGRRGGDWRRGSGTVPAGDGVAPPSLAGGNGAGRNGAGNGATDGRHGVWVTRYRRGTGGRARGEGACAGLPVWCRERCSLIWCRLLAARYSEARFRQAGRTRPPPGFRRRHACTPGRRPRRVWCPLEWCRRWAARFRAADGWQEWCCLSAALGAGLRSQAGRGGVAWQGPAGALQRRLGASF